MCFARAAMTPGDSLPTDPDALRARRDRLPTWASPAAHAAGGARQALSRRSQATENEQRARFIGYPTNRYKLIADACGFGNGLRRLPLTTYRTIRFRPSGVSRAFLCMFIQSSRKSLKPRNSSFLGRDRIKAHIHLADNNFGAC